MSLPKIKKKLRTINELLLEADELFLHLMNVMIAEAKEAAKKGKKKKGGNHKEWPKGSRKRMARAAELIRRSVQKKKKLLKLMPQVRENRFANVYRQFGFIDDLIREAAKKARAIASHPNKEKAEKALGDYLEMILAEKSNIAGNLNMRQSPAFQLFKAHVQAAMSTLENPPVDYAKLATSIADFELLKERCMDAIPEPLHGQPFLDWYRVLKLLDENARVAEEVGELGKDGFSWNEIWLWSALICEAMELKEALEQALPAKEPPKKTEEPPKKSG